MAFAALLFAVISVMGREVSMEEYEVKALFLLHFSKYVDWPPASFAATNSPIRIGVYGKDKFGETLKKVIDGKIISGRKIVLHPLDGDHGLEQCHILFLSDSEKGRLAEILKKIKTAPVLTVGETDQFLELGGMINFVKRDGKIHLEINLEAARQAKLEISSKLLNVADAVKGKSK